MSDISQEYISIETAYLKADIAIGSVALEYPEVKRDKGLRNLCFVVAMGLMTPEAAIDLAIKETIMEEALRDKE